MAPTQHLSAPTFPHAFPTLRQGQTASVLIAGAGMSAGLVNLPEELLKEKGRIAEDNLGINTGLLDGSGTNTCSLYKWAEEVLAKIDPGDGIRKLRLATALGLRKDESFVLMSDHVQSVSRHRVVARLLREGRLASVFTFNWDCRFEHALERAGMKKDTLNSMLPWKSGYCVVVTTADLTGTARPQLVPIHKLHGCARSLDEALDHYALNQHTAAEAAAERFLISADELTQGPSTGSASSALYDALTSAFNTGNLIVSGWSNSDKYLRKCIRDCCAATISHQSRREDVLTCFDLEIRRGHKWLAKLFRRPYQETMALVESSGWTIDSLFEWIWALYALDQLTNYAKGADKSILEGQRKLLETAPTTQSSLISFLHHFLPEWVRMCWRAGLVTYRVGGKPGKWDELLMEAHEEEIPLDLPGRETTDLESAARILAQLVSNGKLAQFDYARTPGAWWNGEELIIVLPTGAANESNDLRVDKPLIGRWKEGCNEATSVTVCPLSIGSGVRDGMDMKAMAKERFINAVSLPRLRKPGALVAKPLGEVLQ